MSTKEALLVTDKITPIAPSNKQKGFTREELEAFLDSKEIFILEVTMHSRRAKGRSFACTMQGDNNVMAENISKSYSNQVKEIRGKAIFAPTQFFKSLTQGKQ